MQIAIDGPAGAGKSTLARMIAENLGFVYVDTGAMYRALAWKIMEREIDLQDTEKIYDLARNTDIYFVKQGNQQKVICDSVDVSEDIRSPRINAIVSIVAAQTGVRTVMVKKQQEMANQTDVVMDGRDIGEQVLPDADFKFYITASIEERARRRVLEMANKGFAIDGNEVRRDMEKRDRMDQERDLGALKILPDSIVIDTSLLNIDEALNRMLTFIGEM